MAVQDDSFELLEAYNLGDDYYWDERALFRYKGKTFGYINAGSSSGYWPCYRSIAYVTEKDFKHWLHSDDDYTEDFHPDEDVLIKYAEKLLHSESDNYTEEEEEE